jgi:hypothetical protein
MARAWTISPWVEQHRDEVSFALQVFPSDTPVNPAAHLLAAGRLAEDLGFDAFFVGDHPAWALDPWRASTSTRSSGHTRLTSSKIAVGSLSGRECKASMSGQAIDSTGRCKRDIVTTP